MRCATDHEPCRQNLATLESSFGGNAGDGEKEEEDQERSNNNLDDCTEALDLVNDLEKDKFRTNLNEVIQMETNQSRVTYHKEDTPSSPSNQGSYFDDF